MVKEIRINKYLAQCNVGSRREVERYIQDGLVKVNGEIVTSLSFKIDAENDEVRYKNEIVEIRQELLYLMLNKPQKYLVSRKDDFGRKTIYDLLPEFNTNLVYVGRLDYMTEGLLLMTNDGDFADKVIHPRYKLPKVYKAVVKGRIDENQVKQLRSGVMIEGRITSTAKVFVKKRLEKNNVKQR